MHCAFVQSALYNVCDAMCTIHCMQFTLSNGQWSIYNAQWVIDMGPLGVVYHAIYNVCDMQFAICMEHCAFCILQCIRESVWGHLGLKIY